MAKYGMSTSEFLSGLDEYLDSFDVNAFLEAMISPEECSETISLIDVSYNNDGSQTNDKKIIEFKSLDFFQDVQHRSNIIEIAA